MNIYDDIQVVIRFNHKKLSFNESLEKKVACICYIMNEVTYSTNDSQKAKQLMEHAVIADHFDPDRYRKVKPK